MNKREKQILAMHDKGCSNFKIADELHIDIDVVRMIVNRKYEQQNIQYGNYSDSNSVSAIRNASQRRPKNRA